MIRKKAAFTLIEVITVLFVISLGMVGTLTLISQNIKSQSVNEKTMIAYQLAQEGIELIRNFRDTTWNEGVDFCFSGVYDSGYITMDYLDMVPFTISDRAQGDLYIDGDGIYRHDLVGFPKSGFNRVMSIKAISDESPVTRVTITADVSWEDHGKPYNYSLETELYDWK